MELSGTQRATLATICDTFTPGDGAGVPSASELGAVDIMAALVLGNPRAAETRQFLRLLDPWDSPIAGLALGGEVAMAALHIMGSARMGGSREASAADPDGATWEVANLIVADASAFPTSSGVNPMISIEAIAHMNAQRLAAASVVR